MGTGKVTLGILVGLALFAVLLPVGFTALAYTAFLSAFALLCFGTRLSLNWQILIGAVLGVGFGAWEASQVVRIQVVGSAFIAALKMLIAPMILLSITSGILGMRQARDLGSIGARTALLYLLSMVLAAALGLLLVNIFEPGRGSSLLESEFFREAAAARKPAVSRELGEFLSGTAMLVLTNPIRALANGQILPIVFFAVLLGVALLQLGERARPLGEALSVANDAVMKMIGWFIRLAPIGIFALLGHLVANVDFGKLLANLGLFIGVVLGATLVHAFISLPAMASWLGGVPPKKLFSALRPALSVAFTTSSSAATLPVTTRCVEEDLGVPSSVSSFVLPLGATVNMDGTALYEAIAAIFVANLYGIQLGLDGQLLVFLMAIVMAVGAPGIPSAGMVTMVVVLEAVGLPVEAVAILISVDRLLDTVRTMANVEGDAVVAVCVARRSGEATSRLRGSERAERR
jgi:Na+/H+-dicarboxylate symporter